MVRDEGMPARRGYELREAGGKLVIKAGEGGIDGGEGGIPPGL